MQNTDSLSQKVQTLLPKNQLEVLANTSTKKTVFETGKTTYVFTTRYPEKNPPGLITEITHALDKAGLFNGVDLVTQKKGK